MLCITIPTTNHPWWLREPLKWYLRQTLTLEVCIFRHLLSFLKSRVLQPFQPEGGGRRDGSIPTTRRNRASYVSVSARRSRRWSCARLPTCPLLLQPGFECAAAWYWLTARVLGTPVLRDTPMLAPAKPPLGPTVFHILSLDGSRSIYQRELPTSYVFLHAYWSISGPCLVRELWNCWKAIIPSRPLIQQLIPEDSKLAFITGGSPALLIYF